MPLLISSSPIIRIVLTVVVGVLSLSCASQEQRRESEFDQQVERARAALIHATDADSLAAAGLLTQYHKSQERLALLAHASAADPERPGLAWLHLTSCVQVETCDPRELEARLRVLAPGNAAAWVGSLARSEKAGDAARLQAVMLEMSSAERFDIYQNHLSVRLTRTVAATHVIEDTPNMELSLAHIAITGALAGEAASAFGAVTRACKDAGLEAPGRLEVCRRIAAVLRRSDSYSTEMVALALAKRVWPPDSAEYREAVEARRIASYRMRTGLEIALSAGPDDLDEEKLLSLLASFRTEQEFYLAQIVGAGRDVNPPPDWKEPK